jgi:hypothetical protein
MEIWDLTQMMGVRELGSKFGHSCSWGLMDRGLCMRAGGADVNQTLSNRKEE